MSRGADTPCEGLVRLVVCPSCRTHLDVTAVAGTTVACPCGTTVEAVEQEGVETTVRRCAGCGAPLDERATTCGYCQSAVVREPQRLTLVCPECLARNPEAGRYCTGCGTEFLPQAPWTAGAAKRCPACEESLAAQRVRDVWLQVCAWCDGLWVPATNLDALVRRMGEDPARAASAGLGRSQPVARPAFDGAVVYRRCPECRQHMVRKNFGRTSGVVVDWCGGHGTWFDADELGRVAAFVAAGGLAAPDPVPSGGDEVRIVLQHAEREAASPWTAWLTTVFNARR